MLQKNQQTREFLRRKQESEYDVMQSNRQEFILYMMFVFGGIFIFLVMNGTADYDKINDKTSHEIQETNFGEPKWYINLIKKSIDSQRLCNAVH